ncbi:MAG: hypothetical protein QF541_08535 [Lentisphaeria bacterium]|jgi:hypothetical protein|nr:hypothetical protein [Lentisphaeria bacterium]|tara:strand:+ start:197 stop:454 length:258 start_codon:yes stop_codon:yes gene_type:complete
MIPHNVTVRQRHVKRPPELISATAKALPSVGARVGVRHFNVSSALNKLPRGLQQPGGGGSGIFDATLQLSLFSTPLPVLFWFGAM